MAPLYTASVMEKRLPTPDTINEPTRDSMTREGGFLEAWAQGYNVGSLVILILIVFCNYRSGIWLHKLILLELILALGHGTFIFVSDPHYGWYLSATATLLFISYQLHNVVSWLKIRPFLPRWASRLFVGTLLLVQPFWLAEAWSNFAYFNGLGSRANERLRPWEALVRDPWWIFTTWRLTSAIQSTYGFSLWALVRINGRFGVMLGCMFVSIGFLLADVVVSAARVTAESGINPYWRFALVFKCASDTIFLDDFKSVLDAIVARKFSSTGGTVHGGTVHGGSGGSRSHVRSRSSAQREPEFIECESIPGHATHSSAPQRGERYGRRLKWMNPFARRGRQGSVPKIHVQEETSVRNEMRTPSSESWRSERGMLRAPPSVVYASIKDGESAASLAMGPAPSNT